jgi:hypothetical protein
MNIRLVCIAVLCAAVAAPANGQLYLIAGSPTQKYISTFGSTLLQVSDDGAVRSVADLVASDVGTYWIAVSYDSRKALILPGYPDNTLTVIDFDKGAVVQKCKAPPRGGSLVYQWLADLPSRGLIFASYVVGSDPNQAQLRGMIMDASVPCDESFMTMTPSDAKYIVAHGRAGVADISEPEGVPVRIDQTGKVWMKLWGADVYFDYELPAALRNGFDQPYVSILVNNSQALVLGLVGKTGPPRILAFRKSDKTWQTVPLKSDVYGCIRGFGRFLVVAEAISMIDQVQESVGKTSSTTKSAQVRESAGRPEWKKTRSATGPSIGARFDEAEAVFPGRLHLYDVDSQRIRTIVTNQGDSEILLVENDIVYYRASDRLYSAEITSKGIENTRLLATADVIRDAHWAFTKH